MTNTPDNTPIQVIDTEPSTQSQNSNTYNQPKVHAFSSLEIEDGRTLGILVHLLGMFTSFFGPLIVYAVTTNPLVKMQSKNALNFQISIAIYFVISTVLCIVLIGFVGLLVLSILAFVLPIIATIKASDNPSEDYNYPLTIKFLS
jgi:uncharacterized protein